VQLARVDLVEKSHHDEAVENDSEVFIVLTDTHATVYVEQERTYTRQEQQQQQ